MVTLTELFVSDPATSCQFVAGSTGELCRLKPLVGQPMVMILFVRARVSVGVTTVSEIVNTSDSKESPPPPGPGLNTVMLTDSGEAISDLLISAIRLLPLLNVVL